MLLDDVSTLNASDGEGVRSVVGAIRVSHRVCEVSLDGRSAVGGMVRGSAGAVGWVIVVSAFPLVGHWYSHSPSLSDLLIVDVSA